MSLLEEARVNESKTPISNRRPWHCALAVRELIQLACTKQTNAAKEQQPAITANIFTGSCTNHIYGGETLTFFEQLAEAGGIVRVIVAKDRFDRQKNQLLRLAERRRVDRPGGIRFLIADTKSHGLENLNHFMVVAERAYRIEGAHDLTACASFDDFSPEVPARICFNDANGGQVLAKAFNNLWEVAARSHAEELPATVRPA